jgi:prephenate dehydrogenase
MMVVATSQEAPIRRLAVVGVGLMGGSLALAARRAAGVSQVVGYDPDAAALDEALRREVITETAGSAADAAAGADLVVISAPVRSIPRLIEEVANAQPRPRLITDIGSTKSAIISGLSGEARRRYIGGHPICGAETSGVRFARAEMFTGATYFLCAPADARAEAYEQMHNFVTRLGARAVPIDADAHDRVMALVSHVPHVLANVLMREVGQFEAGGRRALFSVGPSFKDLTRVAGANPRVWRDIFLENRSALRDSLRVLAAEILHFCDFLEARDESAVGASINSAARFRKELLRHEDIAPQSLYRVVARIPDQPGVLSRALTALGNADINVEDLTLHHFNRETGGDLVLYVSGEEAATVTTTLLEDLGYPTVMTRPDDHDD